ncbi:hypothetical protein BT96DRAFT_1004771 [Gymnopus androsaceus JB14]|uniref:Uncharacterized protein n=1 Tax=Gymnopus androsaceus JB14 TaxID=1447944 RepID=A0A6A4GRA2_9AGAR|nr:hypothetical protein BT96DRAFT_1004771 [Gymnopus androsaceus JB14]
MEVFEVEGSRGLSDIRWAELPLSLLPSPISSTFTLSVHKNVEQFSNCSNGVTVMKKASRLYCLPKDLFFLNGPWYSCRPGGYVRFGSLLNTCSRLGSASWPLKNALDENDPAHAEVLTNIKRRFRSEMLTRGGLFIIIRSWLTLSYQCLQTIQPLSDEELYDKIHRTFVPFKTNFYRFTKGDDKGYRISKTLAEKIRLERLLRWLLEAYQRALFSSWVASHSLYKYGVKASSADFFI